MTTEKNRKKETSSRENVIVRCADEDLDDFLLYLVKILGYSKKTADAYGHDIASYLLFLKEAEASKANPGKETIRTYLTERNVQGLKRGSIKREVSAIRHFYRYLHEFKDYPENPFETVVSPKAQRKLPDFLSHQEINEFLNANAKRTDEFAKRDQAILELMFASGLRASETTNLRLSDVDIKNRAVRILGKGGKERDIPFSKKAKEALEIYLSQSRPLLFAKRKTDKSSDEGFVFLNRNGRPLTVRGLEVLVKTAAQKAGFPLRIHPHMLRHTFATELLDNGADLRVIQELLGHSSINTTSIYTHVTFDDLKKTYENCFPDTLIKEEKRMEKAVVFDFNGTMFFDEDKHVVSWKAYAKEKFGYDLRDEDFIDHVHGHSNYAILKFITGKDYSPEEVLTFAREKELFYQKLCEEDKKNLHLVDGLTEFLSALKERHIRMAIATASMKPNVDWYIKTFHLLDYFKEENIIYDDGTLTKGKPDPMIYLRAFDKLGARPENTLVFEDALSGATSAKRAGAGMVVEVDDKKRKDHPDLNGLVDLVIHDFKKIPLAIQNFLCL